MCDLEFPQNSPHFLTLKNEVPSTEYLRTECLKRKNKWLGI